MKVNNLKTLISLMFIMTLMITNVTFAQKGNNHNNDQQAKMERAPKGGERMVDNIPDITDAQKKDIKAISLVTKKDMLQLKNQLNEEKARLRTLSCAEKADINAINKQIDKISKTQNLIMKRKAKMNQDIRALLTDDQRVYWDSQKGKRKGHGDKGHKKGNDKRDNDKKACKNNCNK